MVRRHELAVTECEPTARMVVEQGVVERAGTLGIDLRDAGHDPDAVLAGSLCDPKLRFSSHGHRLLRHLREGLFGTSVSPPGESLGPDRGRIHRDERFREDDERGSLLRGFRGQLRQLRHCRVAIEDHRLCLHTGDLDGRVHASIVSPARRCPVASSPARRRSSRNAPQSELPPQRARGVSSLFGTIDP
jgi:hypothetical protein